MPKFNVDMEILDVGCGMGHILRIMSEVGFKNLTGIDKYIDKTITIDKVKLIKEELEFLKDSRFDFIMMHHSLEHMPDQHQVFHLLNLMLKSGGKILVRIPVMGYSFEEFRENWVQLDAPRHFFLHSLKSFDRLVGKHGLLIEKTIFDSTSFQFTGSVKYKKNIAQNEEYKFSKAEITAFSAKAKELNEKNQGDSACFILSARD